IEVDAERAPTRGPERRKLSQRVPGHRRRHCPYIPPGGNCIRVVVYTIGHGTRPLDELVGLLTRAAVETLVDVRRYPGSRRNPQFNRSALEPALAEAGIAYRHAVDLGGRLSGEPGEDRFGCIHVAGFRSYAARMSTQRWQDALEAALA